ncbi:MAG: hypothetical protein SVW02_02760 [Candidatus Nanohaloarchaea archaeon]|nr:hypothetical protein [Candidatus Nanohaloarchaea archaeon]
MTLEERAAVGRRKTWQGHDQEDADLCAEGAYDLFDALTDADEQSLETAAEFVQEAFWLADEAEQYQGDKPKLENQKYREATSRLKSAREVVGLAVRPMEYRGNGWWKHYRRANKIRFLTSLTAEHIAEIGWNTGAFRATGILLDAAKEGHDVDDWAYVDDRLEDYYDLAIPYITEG